MGTLFLIDAIYMILFAENMDQISTLVKNGDLDLYLTKPVNSQFMVSLRKIATSNFINLSFVLAYLGWAIHGLPGSVGALQILTFGVLVVLGLVIHYALRFMFASLSLFFHDARNIQFVWYQIYRLGMRPDMLYPYYLRLFVMTLLPVAFFASVPSRLFVNGLPPLLLIASPFLAFLTLWLSHLVWQRALRSYSSASS
jgi:ABC-2 type transport system permease protein